MTFGSRSDDLQPSEELEKQRPDANMSVFEASGSNMWLSYSVQRAVD